MVPTVVSPVEERGNKRFPYRTISCRLEFISVLSTNEIAKSENFGGYLFVNRLSLKPFFLTIDIAWAFRNLCPLGVLKSLLFNQSAICW